LLEFFVAGVTARTAAELAGVNRNSVNLFYNKLRKIIVHFTELASPFLNGEVEVDESYFGGVRKGKRGRGAAGKTPVFGLLKRGGKVFVTIVPHCSKETLMPLLFRDES
jgi:transposase